MAGDANSNPSGPSVQIEHPLGSVIVVNFNGKKHLDACLSSFERLDYPPEQVEILLVDNGSDDGSDTEAARKHPRVRLLRNPVNNFAAALNLGVRESRGDYVVFANNDVFVEPGWLRRLVELLEADPQVGCAGGKVLFKNGRINTVGHRALPDFYWEDEGFNEEDRGQYEAQREVEGLCWAAVLFRRACLENVGPVDEDFVMYYEDVDLSDRCRQLGWKILYTPRAVARHVFHGSAAGGSLAEFFCDRNRLLYVAKHQPTRLAATVATSRFLPRKEADQLYDALLVALKKLIELHPVKVAEPVLREVTKVLIPLYGPLAVDHLLGRTQVVLGQRRLAIGFYDHALHLIGGGQKYGATMAAVLQDKFDVTLLGSRPVEKQDLERWYDLSLSACDLKVIPLPFYDRSGSEIDPRTLLGATGNPFEPVAAESRHYDLLVNVNQLPLLRPLSPFSVFLCHFPDVPRDGYFAADEYSCFLVNSRFTAQWVRKRWGIVPTLLLYPPVRANGPTVEKEDVILSVARFEIGGSKKQHELIRAFEELSAAEPELMAGWRLVLVGGSLPENPYLEKVQKQASQSRAPVEVRVNVSHEELAGWYARAKIFWHACGLNETNPHLIEHFGMTTVEAMQNRCVPIVIDGGGQREIVEHGVSGYRFRTREELQACTKKVLTKPGLLKKLQDGARERGQVFSRERFEAFVREFFAALEAEYRRLPLPDPRDILERRPSANLFYSPAARRQQPSRG